MHADTGTPTSSPSGMQAPNTATDGVAEPGWMAVFGAWLVAMVATLGALFFSEVMELPPCVLCWYQRIFMFPLVLLLPLGLFPFDSKIVRYALPLATGWLAYLPVPSAARRRNHSGEHEALHSGRALRRSADPMAGVCVDPPAFLCRLFPNQRLDDRGASQEFQMNRKILFVGSAVVLVIAFVVGTLIYNE